MPAEQDEVSEAESDGINFLYKTRAVCIRNNSIEFVKTELIRVEGESRMAPVDIEGSNFSINADYVVKAVGSMLDENIAKEIKTNENGYIDINENYETAIPNVFAAGDCIGQKATVAWACEAGKKAAEAISQKFKTK